MPTSKTRIKQKRSWIERIDWWLIILILAFFAISLVIISSAMTGQQYGTNFAVRQVFYYLLGFALALSIMFVSRAH